MPYIVALALTVLVEVAILGIVWQSKVLNSDSQPSVPWIAGTLFLIGLNLITHPLAWWCSGFLFASFMLVEAIVVIAEFIGWVACLALPARQAIFISLVTNAASALAGLIWASQISA